MAANRLVTLLFDPVTGQFQDLVLQDKLEVFYDILGVNCIDIVERLIGGKNFQVMCDDEGLLKEDPYTAILDPWGEQCPIVGRVLFFNLNPNGDLVSLTARDKQRIRKAAIPLVDFRHDTERNIITLSNRC